MSREKSREKNLVTRPTSVFTLLVLLCVSLLAGCGQSRPTDFYMLTSDHVPLNAASLPARTMAIGALIVPGYLDRPGVVVRAADGTADLCLEHMFQKMGRASFRQADQLLRLVSQFVR